MSKLTSMPSRAGGFELVDRLRNVAPVRLAPPIADATADPGAPDDRKIPMNSSVDAVVRASLGRP